MTFRTVRRGGVRGTKCVRYVIVERCGFNQNLLLLLTEALKMQVTRTRLETYNLDHKG